MTKNFSYIPHLKTVTTFDLKRSEKIYLKNEQEALAMAKREREHADEIRMEINYRNNEKAREIHKSIIRCKKMIADHDSGKTVLHPAKIGAVLKAVQVNEDALKLLLLLREDDL